MIGAMSALAKECGVQVAARLVRAWPTERPLAVVWEDGGRVRVGEVGRTFRVERGALEVEADLDRVLREDAGGGGYWIGFVSYDLGRVLEPAVERGGAVRAARDRRWPLLEMQRCERGVEIDLASGQVRGFGGLDVAELSRQCEAGGCEVGEFVSGMDRAAYEAAVRRGVEYIRAGDVFQANISRRLTASFAGSTREAFLRLALAARPRHGAYLELAAPKGQVQALLSVSPELFLDVDAQARRVISRPMKGTRPLSGDAAELEASGKDRAELNMIIDLMRNDLGRVAELGSVRVQRARVIERHGQGSWGVLQAIGEVGAKLREGVSWGEILAATFPPGSVTGAPKIRAMQIIDELEPVQRGPYCGAIGCIGDDGRGRFNVAIRTAVVSGAGERGLVREGVIDYSVGAGIVAESEPEAEWEETCVKAGVLRALKLPDASFASGK
jgi:para-aminobenzoate synthetase component I